MKLIHTIGGFEQPYTVLYREDLDRIYVTDEEGAALRIFDGKTYAPIKSVKLLLDTESIAYDPANHYLYIANGGADEHQTYAFVSIVDANAGAKVADIKIDSDSLKDIVLEKSSPKMYVNDRGKNQVDVIDRKTRTVIASWPITLGKGNVPMALDEAHHRLFVGCRNGQIVIVDTGSGKRFQSTKALTTWLSILSANVSMLLAAVPVAPWACTSRPTLTIISPSGRYPVNPGRGRHAWCPNVISIS
jgi:DNA-binding beta-propeller fold protein YncE